MKESIDSDVPLTDDVRERVILLGGKVAGLDCPECGFRSKEIEFNAHSLDGIPCPECDAEMLTADQKAQLRRAGKL